MSKAGPKPRLTAADGVLDKLYRLRDDLIAMFGTIDALPIIDAPNLPALRSPSEALARAQALKQVIDTFSTRLPQQQRYFENRQIAAVRHALENLSDEALDGALPRAIDWVYTVSKQLKTPSLDVLISLDALLPKTEPTFPLDADLTSGFASYGALNHQRIDPIVFACEVDLRLTRIASGHYLHALTPMLYAVLQLVASGYPYVCPPTRAMSRQVMIGAIDPAEFLWAYVRGTEHALAIGLASFLMNTQSWPDAARLYSEPALDTALAAVRDDLLAAPRL